MSRLSTITLLVLMLLILTAGLLWYFAYAVDAEPPSRAHIPALSAPATIGWSARGQAMIQADTPHDEYLALGYVHGLKRTWPMVLWRETALGRLSRHLGSEVLVLDQMTRRLGFATAGRAAYQAMPEEQRSLLEAYAAGVNAALTRTSVRVQAPFALLDMEVTPWQPFHTLALERLLAWMSTPPLAQGRQLAGIADSLVRADSLLRNWLHLSGFRRSVAWAGHIRGNTHLFSRQVYGNSALPMLQTVSFHRADSSYLLGASLPGTPFFFTGLTPDHAWTILPSSQHSIGFDSSSAAAAISYERITTRSGSEHLLRIRRGADGLALGKGTRPLVLQWAGFRADSDWPAWRRLSRGDAPVFRLLDGNGLLLRRGGSWQILGHPEQVRAFGEGVLVSNSPWASVLADRLGRLAGTPDSTTSVVDWQRDCVSSWARGQSQQLLAAVDSVTERTDIGADMREAVTYLRNWDYAYNDISIAASIFETWAWLLRRQQGHLPGYVADSLGADSSRSYFDNFRRVRLLEEAVEHLAETLGADMSTWRWERAHSHTYYFPVWSSPLLEARALPADGRYAPIRLDGRGHPSAPCGGTTFATPGATAAAAWEGWIRTDSWGTLTLQRRRFETDRFLGRYRTLDAPPPPVSVDAYAEPASTTILVPAPSSP